MIISVGYFFACLLGGGIQTSRLVGPVGLRERNLFVETVNGTGGGPDNGWLGISGFANFEKRDETGDVAVNIRVGVFHGVPDSSLSRQMHHVSKSHHVEKLSQQLGVVQIAFNHQNAVAVKQGFPRLFQRRVVIVVEIVKPNDSISAFFEGKGNVCTDETSRSSHQDGHASGTMDLSGVTDLFFPLDTTP